MIGHLVAFELSRRVKMLSTYVYAGVLFAAGTFQSLAAGGVFKSISAGAGSEKVAVNSPHTLFAFITVISLLGVLMVAAVFGQAAAQDFVSRSWMLVFTKNVRKSEYLIGRFLGAWLFSCVLFLATAVGLGAGCGVVYLVDETQLTSAALLPFLWPYVVMVWPMLLTTGAVFFTLAALTRRMAPVYVGMVVLVLGYLVLSSAVSEIEHRTLASVLDPFGLITFDTVTRYWTPAERNSQLLPLSGLVLANRGVWLGVAVALVALAVARFRTTIDEYGGQAGEGTLSDDKVALPKVQAAPGFGFWLRTAFATGWLYLKEIVRSPIYWAIVVAGIATLVATIAVSGQVFGTATYPVTWQVLDLSRAVFSLFSLIILTFYGGELVWREHDAGMAEIADASRAPTWVAWVAKLFGLWLVALSLQAVIGVSALGSQLARGFTDIDGRQYAVELLFFGALKELPRCVLILTVQSLVGHKYIGHAAMVGWYAVNAIVFGALGVEDQLLRYGAEPRPLYSDMNGYGHRLADTFWFRGYWTAAGLAVAVLGLLFLQRGRESGFKARRAEARRRVTGGVRAVLGVAALACAGFGGFIFYNTHVLNPYRTKEDDEAAQARYEREYKALSSKPQPRIVDAKVAFDIFPEVPKLDVKGTYRLENKTGEPLTLVLLNMPQRLVPRRLAVGKVETPTRVDLELGFYQFELPEPLPPGGTVDLAFDLEFRDHGFSHSDDRTDVMQNGTFFNNFSLPVVGYFEAVELDQDRDRKKYGLASKPRMADRDDAKALQNNYIRQDSDFISFAADVSTSLDQIAIAPGYLEKEWEEGGRRHFRYVMDQPILNFFSVLSARYEVRRDRWNDVALEIYYHRTHTYDLDRMMQGMKDALQYCTDAFGPYQHRQARILEFPRYAAFAQSFPNTIPYSEAIGFIARVRDDDPDDVDYPYYVTAHEIAHQWWAHQVIGGNTQGATMTSETLAQYSALMVMKKKHGPEKMRRFLKYELDHYLIGRALERIKELPLARVENQQYIHYNKGSVAMYALQDFIGEDAVNRALKAYVEKVKFKGPPYTNSTELVSFLKAETPDDLKYLIDDLFETITLYDNRVESASVVTDGGTWDVTMKVVAKKYRAEEDGGQRELEFDDLMDIGALDGDGAALHVEKRRVKNGESTVTFSLDKAPAKVGVDPLNKLVDRTSDDNVTAPK